MKPLGIIIALLCGVFALCVDLFMGEAFGLDAWAPNLLIVVVVWLALTRGTSEGALLAAVLGLLGDGISAGPSGVLMLHSVMLFYLARQVVGRVLFRGLLGRALLGMLIGLTSLALLVVISRTLLPEGGQNERMAAVMMASVLGSIIAVPIVLPLLQATDRRLDRGPEKELR